jgi:hypothetical protein
LLFAAAFIAACPSNFSLLSDDSSSCYSLELRPMSWSNASLYCASLQQGAHLAFVESENEQLNLVNLVAASEGTETESLVFRLIHLSF